ncbi:MAG: tetratricopeptide repeat protein [Candidatus Omnitrophica bacterium]|nr:tetratricopeptide repeat protein [Candidatus Omnitrophota bacterium]
MRNITAYHKQIAQASLFIFVLIINSYVFCADNIVVSAEKIENQIESKLSKSQEKIKLLNEYYNRGRDYLYRKDYNRAMEYFQKALSMQPSYEPARAYLTVLDADKNAFLMNQYYDKARIYYSKGIYENAVSNLEEALKVAPYNEPLKEYFNTVVIKHKISSDQGEISSTKVKMADIISEYDIKIKQVEGLGLGFLLEQALLRCQAGDFAGAVYYYDLCYKLDPSNKERIGWFVNATYELEDLYTYLDESYKKIEELSRDN